MDRISKSWERGFLAAKAARDYATAPIESKKMGAAIFSGSNLIAFGFNNYDKTHTDSVNAESIKRNFNYPTHAEHAALLKIKHYDKKNLIMYIYRESSFGRAISKPCEMCLDKMKESGIRRARFFDEYGLAKEIRI